MYAYRVEMTVKEDGVLHLPAVPFVTGDAVEVIILSRTAPTHSLGDFPLAGTVVRYDEPTAPVADSEWAALQ